MHDTQDGKLSPRAWWMRQLRQGLVMFLYLWALLALFVLNETIFNRQHGTPIAFQGFALLNALALTKVMMTAGRITLSRHLSAWPGVLTVVFDAALCTGLFLIVHTLQRIIVGTLKGEALSASMPSFGGGGLAGIVTVALIFLVSLLPFFTFKHLALAIGEGRMRSILLQPAGR